MDKNVIGLAAVICIFGGPFIGWILTSGFSSWERVQKHREEAALKHRLLDSGMSADEIVRVIECGQAVGEGQRSEELV